MNEELTPFPCGCGGEAKVLTYCLSLSPKDKTYIVICPDCSIMTAEFSSEAEAITAWNKAMDKRTAKVEYIAEVYRGEVFDHYLSGMCGICGEYAYDHAKYCSDCGAKLDWGGK